MTNPTPVDMPVREMPVTMQVNTMSGYDRQPARHDGARILGTPSTHAGGARSQNLRRAVLVRMFFACLAVALALMVLMPAVSEAADVINVNKADLTALQTLPDIGEKRAKAIMAYRKKNGGFGAKSDLLNVPGIGDRILKKISSRISTSGGVSKVKADKSKSASKDVKKDSRKSKTKKTASDDGRSKPKTAKTQTAKTKAAKTKDKKKTSADGKKSKKKSTAKDKKKPRSSDRKKTKAKKKSS